VRERSAGNEEDNARAMLAKAKQALGWSKLEGPAPQGA